MKADKACIDVAAGRLADLVFKTSTWSLLPEEYHRET